MFDNCCSKFDMFETVFHILEYYLQLTRKKRTQILNTFSTNAQCSFLASTLGLSLWFSKIFIRTFIPLDEKRIRTNDKPYICHSRINGSPFSKNTVVPVMAFAVSSLRKNRSVLLKTTNPRTKATIEVFLEIDTAAFVRLKLGIKFNSLFPFWHAFRCHWWIDACSSSAWTA